MSRGVVPAALLAALLAACGSGSSRPVRPVGPAAPLVPTPTPAGDAVASGATTTVGPGGATVVAPDGGLTLVFPPAAVATTTAVTVTPIANMARGGIGPAYRLGPEGSTFAAPVTITFQGPDGYPLGTSLAGVGIEFQDRDHYWHRVEPAARNPAANTISVTTTHFSDWALTWQGGTAAAEGPIWLDQTYGPRFTASGRATVYFLSDDDSDTSYGLTGTLTLQDPTVSVGGATCVPDQRTLTLPLNVAEAHKSAPPVFRWGIGVHWTLSCSDGSKPLLPAVFDTMGINPPVCPGAYDAGQVVSATALTGVFRKDCDVSGHVWAGWNLQACVPDLPCSTGADCRLGITTCDAGIQACVDVGPAPDGTACGPLGAWVCSVLQCVNPNDPLAGILVSPTSGLFTTEAGGTATFTIVLTEQPTGSVTIALSSSDPAEGTVSPASLTFTPSDWSVPQTVTVTGVDDFVMDGAIAYTIVTAPAVSIDPRYSARDAADVSVTNLDDDFAGFVVTPTTGLVTTEAGGTASFTIALTSQPVADVFVALSSSNPLEGLVFPSGVTFTPASWNVPQTVTVTGVDDLVQDGPQLYSIVTAPAASVDPNYSGMDAPDVTVTNLDDDHAGVTVTPTSGLVTTEAGGTATFTVVLASQPIFDVTIPLHSSRPSEGTVSPASLTFTSANWSAAQTVTVTGVDDLVADGPQTYAIVTDPAISLDPVYAGTDAPDVAVTNLDNDVAGIAVTPTVGLVTTEAGGTATFTVVLTSQPTADVVVPLRSSRPTEGTVSAASLIFTSASWDVAQVVTVTGVNDLVADGPQVYTIITDPAQSSDPLYAGLDPADVTVTNLDDDVAGIFVTPTSGLVTSESGGAATFTIALGSQPTADVTIPLFSSNVAEVTVSPASVVFTAADWSVPHVVVLTGVDDLVMDGDQLVTISAGTVLSADPVYAGTSIPAVTVTNLDDDHAGVTVTPTSGLVTTEAGGAATFTVRLDSQPTGAVTIGLRSSNAAEGTVSPASLTFDASNWSTPQTATVTGVNDFVVDGPQAYTIITDPATSADPAYAGLDPADVSVTNLDDDVAGVTVTPTSGLVTTEASGTATFTVVLTSRPTADVIIPLHSSRPSEGTVSPASLTFTAGNWNVAQTVTVTGVNDAVADGPQAYTIVTDPATSADPAYNGLNAPDVSVTNLDDDVAGIVVTPTSGLVTTEAGGTATFTVALASQPTADVVIPLHSSRPSEGTVSPASLTFTAATWNVAQLVTVTGVDDLVADGPQVYTIVTDPALSADPGYAGRDAADVSVTNLDDDVAGIAVTPTSGLVTSEAGGAATFDVVLLSKPTADVTIPLSSSRPGEVSISTASLTFTPATWDLPQTVVITGVDDLVMDGDQLATIVTGAASSADAAYAGLDAADVSVTNLDDDVAGITVTPTAGLVTTEAGGTATFTVVLTSQPVADVTIGLRSSDAAEGTVSTASVTFTPATWDVAQVVTVTGVDDAVADGPKPYAVVTDPASSADPAYAGRNAADVAVTNLDDDHAGVTVTPTSGLVTTEAGGTATFTVVLTSQPTADVTIPLRSSRPSEGAVSPASLTFTSATWSTAQTVTVTGVDDLVADGPQTYAIITDPAVSLDPVYANTDAPDVSVTNLDDDVPGIAVVPTAGLVTTEAGGTATFTVVLTSQPTSDVTIPLRSSNLSEGTVSPASLTFTSGNWSIAQSVTVTGVNDLVADGPQDYLVITDPAVSADPSYAARDAADVLVTNLDNDVAGVFVTPTSGLLTSEVGATATFTIALGSQPAADVTIPLVSTNTAEVTVSPATVVFTVLDWNVPHVVVLTGVDDLVMDGDQLVTIVAGTVQSADPVYAGTSVPPVFVTNVDDDVAGIAVTPTSGLVTTEAGGTATFTVVLTSRPLADVSVALTSSNPAEGTVSPASVTFTAGNWNVARTVTVTGVNDFVADGPRAYTIVTAPATSSDPIYAGLDPADVSVTNLDDDVAGVTVTPTSGLVTTEAGGTATFTVVLTSRPTADVVIPLHSSRPSEGTVSPATLTFTAGNWNVAQTVTVTGVNDAVADGPQAYTIVTDPATSADPAYNGLNAPDVSVTNLDDDVAGITVTPTAGLITTEAGGTATFTVRLQSQPTADVVIPLRSSNLAEGTVSPAFLTFTALDWSVAQTVTVTGVNDAVADGPQGYVIITDPALSSDPGYSGRDAADVLVTNTDDDVSGIVVSPTSGLFTTESGGAATFSIVLSSQPTADVTIDLSSSNTAEVTVSPASLTFNASTWSIPQVVVVTGVDDLVMDGDQLVTIVTAAAVSADPVYSGMDAADVTVTNVDDDLAGITVTPTSGLVTTEAGGTATFTVVLTSQPTADVVIPLRSSNLAEGTVSPASLTFTALDWSIAQTVTVTGVNDFVADGPQAYLVITDPAVSGDPVYSGRDAADVSVTNTDEDVPGIVVAPTSGLVTSESGGAATFSVVLSSQPTADVTIDLSSSNTAEVTVSPATLTFNALTWSTPQVVVVTGVDDLVMDGDQLVTIVTAAAVSADPVYSGMDPPDVTVTNVDDDLAGITVTPTSGLETTASGGAATFTVVLTSQPTGDVTIALASSSPAQGDVAPASLTFTPGDWDAARLVTVTGASVPGAYSIVTSPATSGDPVYSGMDAADVFVTNVP